MQKMNLATLHLFNYFFEINYYMLINDMQPFREQRLCYLGLLEPCSFAILAATIYSVF